MLKAEGVVWSFPQVSPFIFLKASLIDTYLNNQYSIEIFYFWAPQLQLRGPNKYIYAQINISLRLLKSLMEGGLAANTVPHTSPHTQPVQCCPVGTIHGPACNLLFGGQ